MLSNFIIGVATGVGGGLERGHVGPILVRSGTVGFAQSVEKFEGVGW